MYGIAGNTPIAYSKQMIKIIVVILVLLSSALITVVSWRSATRLITSRQQRRQQRYLDQPELHPRALLAQYKLTARGVDLTCNDGVHVTSYYHPGSNGAVIVLCHGYKMDSGEMVPVAAMLARHGFGILLLNLRAHGPSPGDTIRFGQTEWRDFAAAVDFILTRQPGAAIGLFGNSMGGALALCYAARDKRVKAVAAHSPYASISDSLNVSVRRFTGLPAFPFARLIKYFASHQLGFEISTVAPLRCIGRISPRAVLLMMGGKDSVVNPGGINLLYATAGQPRQLWFESQLDHVEFHQKMPQQFEQRLCTFYQHFLLNNARQKNAL